MSRWHGSTRESLGGFSWDMTSPRRALKAKKRLEAEERNAKTPLRRRKAYRRQFEQATAALTAESKKSSKKNAA